jgi:hypothetical protein
MKWVAETLDQRVDDELNALPSALRARLSRIVELICQSASKFEQVSASNFEQFQRGRERRWETSGYRKGAPGLIRPTPIYGQKVYAALVDREAVPNSGQWVTAYPTPDGRAVHFENPVILFNNRTGMSYIAEKEELDLMLQNKLSFQSWRKIAPVPGIPFSFDGPISLLAPHEMGNLGYLCAQRQLFDAARSW